MCRLNLSNSQTIVVITSWNGTIFGVTSPLWGGGGIHRWPAGQWHGVLMFSLICAWTNDWANNRDAGYFGGHCAHYDVTVMLGLWHVQVASKMNNSRSDLSISFRTHSQGLRQSDGYPRFSWSIYGQKWTLPFHKKCWNDVFNFGEILYII